MRNVPPSLAAALAREATTLARCWKITRRDGLTLGFTDHDRDLTIGAQTYAALTGVDGTQIQSDFGFNVGGGEIAGALSAQGLLEADLAKGLWDSAAVEIYLVDWRNPADALLIDKGALGDVRRQGVAFTAELRGLAHQLDEERGRIYSAHCPAILGDSACGIDIDLPQWRHEGAVVAVIDGHSFSTLASSHAEGLFTGGKIEWLGGANKGAMKDVCAHQVKNTLMEIQLWSRFPQIPASGDLFRIHAGCDKQFATCRERFANAANFRGFPHMPGNDYVVQVAREGEPAMDGGSLFKP